MFGNAAYSMEERESVYDEMLDRAARYLDSGLSVVLDATFLSRRLRARARKLALDRDLRFQAIEVIADEQTVKARLQARSAGSSASDARWDTYLAQREHFEPLDELAAAERITLDSSEPLDKLVAAALACLAD
jgi:predicted kinase